MTRVLILDDDQCRHDAFSRRLEGCHLDHAYTAKQAIEKLSTEPAYDLVCLDHDLDLLDEQLVAAETGNGAEVARFIAMHLDRRQCPRQVLVHSWNEPASDEMVATLRAANVPVVRRAFSSSLYWLRVSP